jgi:hypothetical protein
MNAPSTAGSLGAVPISQAAQVASQAYLDYLSASAPGGTTVQEAQFKAGSAAAILQHMSGSDIEMDGADTSQGGTQKWVVAPPDVAHPENGATWLDHLDPAKSPGITYYVLAERDTPDLIAQGAIYSVVVTTDLNQLAALTAGIGADYAIVSPYTNPATGQTQPAATPPPAAKKPVWPWVVGGVAAVGAVVLIAKASKK